MNITWNLLTLLVRILLSAFAVSLRILWHIIRYLWSEWAIWCSKPENRPFMRHTRTVDFWSGKRKTPWMTDEELHSAFGDKPKSVETPEGTEAPKPRKYIVFGRD